MCGEPLDHLVGTVSEVLNLSQARIAGLLGMSQPMLSQLVNAQRVKIGDPVAANAPMYHPGRNLVREGFLDPTARRLFPDWPHIAEQTVAAPRAAADPLDPWSAALVAELRSHDEDSAGCGCGTTYAHPETRSSGSTIPTWAGSSCAARASPSPAPTTR